MKQLFLIRGLSGSGKTTVAHSFCAHCISADDYFMEDGEYRFDTARIKKAHNDCQKRTESCMEMGVNVAVHNTFTCEWEMEPYYKMAKKHGYRVFSIIVENRHAGESVHGVPEETLQKQEERFSVKLQ